jgi:hypothetical protein
MLFSAICVLGSAILYHMVCRMAESMILARCNVRSMDRIAGNTSRCKCIVYEALSNQTSSKFRHVTPASSLSPSSRYKDYFRSPRAMLSTIAGGYSFQLTCHS